MVFGLGCEWPFSDHPGSFSILLMYFSQLLHVMSWWCHTPLQLCSLSPVFKVYQQKSYSVQLSTICILLESVKTARTLDNTRNRQHQLSVNTWLTPFTATQEVKSHGRGQKASTISQWMSGERSRTTFTLNCSCTHCISCLSSSTTDEN